MLFTSLASGSTGNCALYIGGGARILVDAGMSTRFIAACLRELGLELRDLTHVLITHNHGDHIAALPVLGKHTGAELVCSEDTYNHLREPWQRCAVFEPGESFELAGCDIVTFPTPHDAPGSCGYVLGSGSERLGYCTDLGEITMEVFTALSGCPTLFLESNHDLDMLKHGPYPPSLKRRILGPTGHLSNTRCAQGVVALAKTGTRRFILGHLSQENNTPALALRESETALEATGAAIAEVDISVAPVAGVALPVRC